MKLGTPRSTMNPKAIAIQIWAHSLYNMWWLSMKDLAEVVSKGPCRWRQYFFVLSGNRKKDVKGIYQGRSSTKLETFLVTDFIFCATLALQRLLARALASRKHRKAPLRAVSAGTGPKAQVSRFKKLRNTRFASQMFCLVKCDLNDLNRFNMI